MQALARTLATNPKGASGARCSRLSQIHTWCHALLGNKDYNPVADNHGNGREEFEEIYPSITYVEDAEQDR